MRIGIVGTVWLPFHGGGEFHIDNMVNSFKLNGVEVFAYCSTPKQKGKYNGSFPVERWQKELLVDKINWRRAYETKTVNREVFELYEYMSHIVKWAVDLQLDTVIIAQMFNQVRLHQVRELYLQLKAKGIKVGVMYYDYPKGIQQQLVHIYKQKQNNWEDSVAEVKQYLSNLIQANNPLQVYFSINNPLFFEPDFIVPCSEWSCKLVDPLDSVSKFVLHPILNTLQFSHSDKNKNSFSNVDILMINPQRRKNPEVMAALINNANDDWTFRVLRGGWGSNAFETFIPMIKDSKAYKENRIDFVEYVEDISEVYKKSGLVFFPSRFEGYGLTAVEPMLFDVPVVSSSYPAILEAVGEGAYTLCPFTSTVKDWHLAVEEVLSNRSSWVQKGRERIEYLIKRQEEEMKSFISFLEK